jgi:hypothetical protein
VNRWHLTLDAHGVELVRWEGMAESREEAEKALLAVWEARTDMADVREFAINSRVVPS